MISQTLLTGTLNQNKHLTCLLEQFHLLLFPAVLETHFVLALSEAPQQFLRQCSIIEILWLQMSCSLLPFASCFTSLVIYKSKMFMDSKTFTTLSVRIKGILSFPEGLWKNVCEVLQYSKFPHISNGETGTSEFGSEANFYFNKILLLSTQGVYRGFYLCGTYRGFWFW